MRTFYKVLLSRTERTGKTKLEASLVVNSTFRHREVPIKFAIQFLNLNLKPTKLLINKILFTLNVYLDKLRFRKCLFNIDITRMLKIIYSFYFFLSIFLSHVKKRKSY